MRRMSDGQDPLPRFGEILALPGFGPVFDIEVVVPVGAFDEPDHLVALANCRVVFLLILFGVSDHVSVHRIERGNAM